MFAVMDAQCADDLKKVGVMSWWTPE
jgi:hypothetical protein